MCQVSQPMVATGSGSGSVSTQSGAQRPCSLRDTDQVCSGGAGDQWQSSSLSASRCSCSSDHVVLNCVRRIGTTFVTPRILPGVAASFAADGPARGQENGDDKQDG